MARSRGPAPEDSLPDAEEQVADRLTEEATMLISCVGWLESLAAGETPAVNLRPDDDLPETCYVGVDHGPCDPGAPAHSP